MYNAKLKSLPRPSPLSRHLEDCKQPPGHHRRAPLTSKHPCPRIVLTENSDFPHSVRTKTHRKAISLATEPHPETLFAKSHRRLSSDVGRRATPKPRHRHSTSMHNGEKVTGNQSKVRHDRHQSLQLDLESMETEYSEEDLSNCSTKKIIAKQTLPQALTSDLKLVTYIRRYCREHGKAPSSSLDFYKLGPVLGRGAFSVVFSAVHRLTRVPVAVKSIEKSTLIDPKRARKLSQEVDIMRGSAHPCLLQLFELIETASHIHLVMEYMSGGSLLSLVQAQGKLSEKAAKAILGNVASGLKSLHERGVVHRDVKLDNILTGAKGAKLGDFGVSKAVHAGERLVDQSGTPSYLAPEVLSCKDYCGQAADMWSLGVCLYGLLCGTLPFKGFNLPTLHKSILSAHYVLPADLSWSARDLLSRLLCKDPETRLSASSVLRHSWLREAKPPLPAQSPDLNSEAIAESSKFGLNPNEVRHSVAAKDLSLAYGVYTSLLSAL